MAPEHPPIPIGLSQCLVGDQVRYDGGHKYSALCKTLTEIGFELIPFCPEVGIGLSVPRDPIHLIAESEGEEARAIQQSDRPQDISIELRRYAQKNYRKLVLLSGFILKEKSPSCGLERIPVYLPDGRRSEITQAGLFAAELQRLLPNMPVIEELALQDSAIREHFLIDVHAYHQKNINGIYTNSP